jgi:hypothetical protein
MTLQTSAAIAVPILFHTPQDSSLTTVLASSKSSKHLIIVAALHSCKGACIRTVFVAQSLACDGLYASAMTVQGVGGIGHIVVGYIYIYVHDLFWNVEMVISLTVALRCSLLHVLVEFADSIVAVSLTCQVSTGTIQHFSVDVATTARRGTGRHGG